MNISILIPVFNERDAIKRTLRALIPEKGSHEVLIVDLGSTDGTLDVVKEYDWVKVVSPASRPRAAALNEVVAQAQGDAILFLEAGSLPARGWSAAITNHLDKVADAGHMLCKEVDATSAWSASLRSALGRLGYQITGGPSGLNGVVVKKETFDKVEGFRPVPDFEWLAFSNRLKNHGASVKVLKHDVLTTPKPGSGHADAFQELKEDVLSALKYRRSEQFDGKRSRRGATAAILVGYDFFGKLDEPAGVATARKELFKISVETMQSFRGVGNLFFIGGNESTKLLGQASGIDIMAKPRTAAPERFAELLGNVLAQNPEGVLLVKMGISTDLSHANLLEITEGPAENPCVMRPVEHSDEWLAVFFEKAALEALPSLEIGGTMQPIRDALAAKIVRTDVEDPISALRTDSDARGMYYAGQLQELPG